MATAPELDKTRRGTKRSCPECSTRFYDLMRDSIACPACGVDYVPAAHPVAQAAAPAAPYAAKTGWRSKPYKRPEPLPAKADAEPAAAAAAEVDDEVIDDAEVTEDAAAPMADDEVVLEQESDDDDLSDLVDHDAEDPKEH